jgi:glycosyltransferase involved in cell wall biosynthesis
MATIAAPKVSVIVATYRPGDQIQRVFDSLDAQTMPASDFETIFVDDGSGDGTVAILERYASTRPNVRVVPMANSGWPSRPRNTATELARGEYVLFMDHDDSLYPDALRRAVEFGAETRADVISPKESKTSDVWWCMSALEDGNVRNALNDGGIARLLPMVPHKFYRRRFLLDNGIRFPDGRRALWEDVYQNVEAYRHANVVAVLADSPTYLWHAGSSNSSKTYGPRTEEYWDRLDDLMSFIDVTLDGPDYADARRCMLMHQYRSRALGRLTRMLADAGAAEVDRARDRAMAIQRRYITDEWDRSLGKMDGARATLLRAGRMDLLRDLHAHDGAITSSYVVAAPNWRGDVFSLRVDAQWRRDAAPLPLARRGGRVLRCLPGRVHRALPPELVDVTDDIDAFTIKVGVRDRERRVTWELPGTSSARFESIDDRFVTVAARVDTAFDPALAALGAGVRDVVHDLYGTSAWLGAARAGALEYRGRALPALVGRRSGVAYSNTHQRLSVDLGSGLRNVVKDGRAALDRLDGSAAEFTVPLPAVHVGTPGTVPVDVDLDPVADAGLQTAALPQQLRAWVSGDRTGARLIVAGPVAPGRYRVSVGTPTRPALATPLLLTVQSDGGVTMTTQPRTARAAGSPSLWRRLTGALRRS